jgi:hypothetical protein
MLRERPRRQKNRSCYGIQYEENENPKICLRYFAPAAALFYLFSLNVVTVSVSSETQKMNKMALIKSERSIENLNQRAWYSELLPKRPMRAIAMKK